MRFLSTAIRLIAIALPFCPSAFAHHSQAMFDTSQEIVIEGTVAKFDWVNPHMYLIVETKGPDGKPALVEGEGLGITQALVDGLKRDALKPGTPVVMRANPNRGGWGKQVRILDVTTQDGEIHPFYTSNAKSRTLTPAESLASSWAPSRAAIGAGFGAMASWNITPAGRAAQKTLAALLQKNSGYIPALVAMGLCKFLQGSSSDARNYLKQVIKNQYALEFAESFEKALLLMADYFISVNTFDLAEAELQKVLKHNQSNVKAEELMGLIKEKERAYVDAASHYEKAFEMSSRKNEVVGFRLAFNYLKAERYIDCVDISKEVKKVNPSFPGIQTELIDKARVAIRK